jgi:hypothetical protein
MKKKTETVIKPKAPRTQKQKVAMLQQNAGQQSYQSAPVSVGLQRREGVPKVQSLPRGSTRVSHREYVLDVFPTAPYSAISYVVNPGRSQLFPWLWRIASGYESYKFHSLRFIYETMTNTTQVGTVIMAIDADAHDEVATTKAQLLEYEGATSTAVWLPKTMVVPSPILNKRTSYFVTDQVDPSGDNNLYHTGRFQIATSGNTASAVAIGELYVEYDVTFSTPQLGNIGAGLTKSLMSTGIGISSTGYPYPFVDVLTGSNISVGSSHGTTSTTFTKTYTFNVAMNCLIAWNIGGTGLGAPFAVAGTSTIVALYTQIGFGTQVAGSYLVTALAGQTFVISGSHTTLVNAMIFMAQDCIART